MLSKTQVTEIFAVTRKSEIPIDAFEETHEGRMLWSKIVRLKRIIRHDEVVDVEMQIDASVYSLCLAGATQVWIRKDTRSAMMYRADRPVNHGVPITRTEKAAALARGEAKS